MNRAARRLSRRRIGGLAGMSLVATTGLLGGYLGNPRIPRAYAAAVCTVTSSNDDGAGSLREALAAHALDGDDCSTINFAPSVTTITLASDLPAVTSSSLTIIGPGSSVRTLTVNLNSKSGIRFTPAATGQSLVISGLTLTGGRTTGAGKGVAVYAYGSNVAISDVTFTSNTTVFGKGGAVAVIGTSLLPVSLGITNSSFTTNSGEYGGAVYSKRATVDITGTTFTTNRSSYSGGAVYAADGQVGITNSTFTSNIGGTNGGAVFVWNDGIDVTNSTFTDNETGSVARKGGAIYASQEVNASSSTFSGNTASGKGGAIYSKTTTVTLTNSTITGNSAFSGAGVAGQTVTATATTLSQNNATYLGGAIYSMASTVTLTNGTLTGNSAPYAAGIFAMGNVTANFTTFSGNISSGAAIIPGMTIALGTYTVANSIFNETGLALSSPAGSLATFSFFTSSSALANNTAPSLIFATTASLNLGVLADNGGATLTMLPGTGSPVIGAADPDSTTPTIDQRGVTRTSPSTMGAVHVAFTPTPTPTPTPDPDPVPTETPSPTPTSTPTTSVVPVVVPVVSITEVLPTLVLPPAGVVLLTGAARANAQVVEVREPVSVTLANAPQVSVPAGAAVAPVVSGLPANTSVVVSIRAISGSRPQSVLSLLRAKSPFVPMGTIQSTAAGRVKVPAFKARRAGVYLIRLSTPAGKSQYLKVKVTARKSTKP